MTLHPIAARLRAEPERLSCAPAMLAPPPGASEQSAREAAVLVPVVLHPEPTILLTLRTATLSAHAGQVSLPGGRIEAHDPSPEAAALREAEEEVGIPRQRVEVIGRLPSVFTGTGFRVTPVVGLVLPPISPRPDPREVAEVFELPLAHLTEPALAPRLEDGAAYGSRRPRVWVVPHDRHVIWGATAAILASFAMVLREV
ncbi:MAG: CoA pyrophosphatase [Elioraea sp.]|nr:CoA pyrophosphatase [Elioraea sp.]